MPQSLHALRRHRRNEGSDLQTAPGRHELARAALRARHAVKLASNAAEGAFGTSPRGWGEVGADLNPKPLNP